MASNQQALDATRRPDRHRLQAWMWLTPDELQRSMYTGSLTFRKCSSEYTFCVYFIENSSRYRTVDEAVSDSPYVAAMHQSSSNITAISLQRSHNLCWWNRFADVTHINDFHGIHFATDFLKTLAKKSRRTAYIDTAAYQRTLSLFKGIYSVSQVYDRQRGAGGGKISKVDKGQWIIASEEQVTSERATYFTCNVNFYLPPFRSSLCCWHCDTRARDNEVRIILLLTDPIRFSSDTCQK